MQKGSNEIIYIETIATTLLDIISEYFRQNDFSVSDIVTNDKHDNMFVSYSNNTHRGSIIDIYITKGSIRCYNKYYGEKDLLFEITYDDRGCHVSNHMIWRLKVLHTFVSMT